MPYFLILSNPLSDRLREHIISEPYQIINILLQWTKVKNGFHFWYECESHIVYPKFVHSLKMKRRIKKELITTIKAWKKTTQT